MHTLKSLFLIRRDQYQYIITPVTQKWDIYTFCYHSTYISKNRTILLSNNRWINFMPLNCRQWAWLREILENTVEIILRGSSDDEKITTKNYKTIFKSTGAIYQQIKNLSYLLTRKSWPYGVENFIFIAFKFIITLLE